MSWSSVLARGVCTGWTSGLSLVWRETMNADGWVLLGVDVLRAGMGILSRSLA
jgi:hypothetical protein